MSIKLPSSLKSLLSITALLICSPLSVVAENCVVRDFLELPLTQSIDPMQTALEIAYPGLNLDPTRSLVEFPDGTRLNFRGARRVTADKRLEHSTLGDQFHYTYPLGFTLTERKQLYFDPGRIRWEQFFRSLYFETRNEARRSLSRVTYTGTSSQAVFNATKKYCVHVQLRSVLEEIAAYGPAMDVYFEKSGGSFNWRVIAGTNRLSTHSFGIAVDLNTQLGKYWRWDGGKPGSVGPFANEIPFEIVSAFERRGFIWGGKWYHYDGMHFEYRPELILYSRLMAQNDRRPIVHAIRMTD
ncbi:M15 family metallopeptidase [Cognatishimia sp. D5M38]|uniref:M15 family metallopeptidase n=1 Tax=Cognatishimia coralii TaxID=3083254 RepID=A0ABU8QHG9_9RHOB